MSRIKYFLYLGIFLLFSQSINSQVDKTYLYDDVIITSARIPTAYRDLIRKITLLRGTFINNVLAATIPDVLNYTSADLKARGPLGVQSDISIRGGTFEQTLIMVDGIKINDPQTAHHNLNLPFTLSDIDRIEILRGQGSSIFGPDAFSGIINFITRKNTLGEISLKLSGGQNNFFKGELSMGYPAGKINSRISLSKNKSDGYRYNTHFDNSTVSLMNSADFGSGRISLIAGYNVNKFGANNFYSDIYPHQWEEIKTFFSGLSADIAAAGFTFAPKLFTKIKKDDYILDFTRPEFYRNRHDVNSYGVELQVYKRTRAGSFALGGELNKDEIESSNLGNHQRVNKGISLEYHSRPFENMNIVLGTFAYKYGNFKWQVFPGMDIGYRIAESFQVTASVGKSFRIPSYTDLYYNSPAQKGNSSLLPEEALSFEAGLNYTGQFSSADLSVFRRSGKNIIDWIRSVSSEPWTSRNITEVNTTGFEFDFNTSLEEIFSTPFRKLTVSYTYLDSDKESENLQSKYVMDFLRHKVSALIENRLPFNIEQNWTIRYCSRTNLKDYFIADTKVQYSYSWFRAFLQASNLFNVSYSDFGSIPLPGRWIIAGIEFHLTKNTD